MNAKAKVHNFFEVEVYDASTNELKQTARAENIVLNKYFSIFETGIDIYGVIHCINIAFGRGTGTPVRTRTDLFNRIDAKLCTLVGYTMENPTSSVTRQIRLDANQYNGEVISEVGFESAIFEDGRFSTLVTHALLQDSEGNPITITKTDTDVIYIKGTFFATVTAGTGMGTGGVYNLDASSFLRQFLLGLWTLGGGLEQGHGKGIWGQAMASRWPVSDIAQMKRCDPAITNAMWEANKPFYGKSGVRTINPVEPTFTWDAATKTLTGSLINLLDTQYLNQTFTQIGSILGVVTLPNHDIFPPYAVIDKSIGIGNGTIKDFNIGCPHIMPDTESIYVNGVLKTKDVDYTIDYENNCVDMNENYISTQYSCFDDNIEFGDFKSQPMGGQLYWADAHYDPMLLCQAGAQILSGWVCPEQYKVDSDTPILIDYLTPQKCNKIKLYGSDYRLPSTSYPMVVEYSDDGETYTEVEGLTMVSTTVPTNTDIKVRTYTWTPVTARYWRMHFGYDYSWTAYCGDGDVDYTFRYPSGAYWSVNGLNYKNRFMMGYQSPGLHFINAPAPGSIITADYSLDVLFKTANNILRWQYAVTVDFGENS